MRRGALLAALLTALAAALAAAQVDRYELIYGAPIDVSLEDLVFNPAAYEGRAVRTHGILEPGTVRSRTYALRGGATATVRIVPMPEVASEFEFAVTGWLGREIEVTGVFGQSSFGTSGAADQSSLYFIQFWGFVGPEEKEAEKPVEGKPVTLEGLVTSPGRHDGKIVRVVGKFRGRNLYGDLPVKSQRSSRDWVIKDDLYAVWVTGKKPKGSGWQLDPTLKRDTGKWIEVVGRIETRGAVTYIQARQVSLATPPTPTSEAQPPPPPPEKPKAPPVVVFALPLDGDSEVPSNSRFVVQFSRDMNEESFRGRVLLRYAGPELPGDRGFDGMKLSYDGGRRALTVDPGDVLRPGRTLELLLLPGITDVDGLPLVPRDGEPSPGEVVDVLRYHVGT